jgi:hypothetical protein
MEQYKTGRFNLQTIETHRNVRKSYDRTLPHETLLRNKKVCMCGLWARSRAAHEEMSVQIASTRPCLDKMAHGT